MAIVRLQQRRGSSVQWIAGDFNGDPIVLASGEIGLETNTGKFKIGDGETEWSNLPYENIGNLNPISPLAKNINSSTKQLDLSIIVGEGGVQGYSSSLNNIANLSNTAGFLQNNGIGGFSYNSNVLLTSNIGVSVQAYNANLGNIATLGAGTDTGFLQKTAENVWSLGTFTDTNYYPTAISWSGGTIAGPTISLIMSGIANLQAQTIPSASATASGVVTTGPQEFGGIKTFTSPSITTSIDTGSITFNLLNTTATTINFGGAATSLTIGATTGASTTIRGTLINNIINATAATGINPSLFGNTTTGNISIGAGLTTGQLNIATVGTGATPITIGHTNATTTINGSFKIGANTTISPSASTAATITLPSSTSTLATIAGTETLTNKTLTSPILSTPTFSNTPIKSFIAVTVATTVTVDASADELIVLSGSYSAPSTVTIDNLTEGKLVRILLRNTNATSRLVNLVARIDTTSATTAVIFAPAAGGGASVNGVTLTGGSGTAMLTVFNVGGVFYGAI